MFQDPVRMNLKKLFACEKIAIPIYQRGYAWSDEEVEDYIQDITDLLTRPAGSRQEHFLGMMLCYNRADEKWTRVLEIIDGQQRLTTSSILLAAIREAFKRIESAEIGSADLKRKCKKQIDVLNSLLFAKHDGATVTKISLNEKDQEEWARIAIFANAADGEELASKPASAQRLNNAFSLLNDELVQKALDLTTLKALEDSFEHLEQLAHVLLNNMSFVLLTADNEKAVYDLFMIINDRGKPLSPLDLIRTGTLSKLVDNRQSFDKVKALLAPLMDVEDEESRRALTIFVNSFSGSRVAKSAVLKNLSQWLNAHEQQKNAHIDLVQRTKQMAEGAQYLLELTKKKPDWLGTAYPYSADPVGAERQHRLLAALRHDSCKPLLVAAKDTLSQHAFRELLGVIERIALRAFLTNGVHKSLLADFHIEQAARLRASPQSWSPEQLWRDALSDNLGDNRKTIALSKTCPDSLFKQGVRSLEWRNSRGLIAYILLGIESFDFDDARPDYTRSFNWGNIHLDHIIPQSSKDHPVAKSDFLHSIGNLTPLSGRRNSALKDLEYGKEKARVYKESKFDMTKLIGVDHEEQWTIADVQQRIDSIAEKACKVWNLNVDTWK